MKPLNGDLFIYSNSPETQSGYGRQMEQLVKRATKAGARVGVACNYGQEGDIRKKKYPEGTVTLYPKSYSGYSTDMFPVHFEHFKMKSTAPNMLMTLYDTWVLHDNKKLDDYQIHSWTPIDHSTIPQAVAAWIRKDNVNPIAMSPDGQTQMNSLGLDTPYIPHTIETSVYKPGQKIDGVTGKEFLKADGRFVFGMVAANKANAGLVHRKAYAENILAFAQHIKKHPDSLLYIHAETSGQMQGFDILRLLQMNKIPPENVVFPDGIRLRYGFSDTEMAALYEGMDCLLAPSYGEGFQVPLIEAQAVGTKVIASNYTAPKDLLSEDCLKVEGQAFWDEKQLAYYQIPYIGQIVEQMDKMVENRERSEKSIEFAKQFDADLIFQTKWLPYLAENLK